MRTKKGTHLPT